MVRFQAIRSFASAGDSATVDYLVTGQSDAGTSMIAAAVGPAKLSEIHEICEASDLQTTRIALRPLTAAALYLGNKSHPTTSGETVLIDLLADDAEIVVARNGKVIFVRTVRLPSGSAGRPAALAGELRRSLVACGAAGSPDRVVLWGLESLHREDVAKIAEASGSSVDVINPFDLVDVSRSAKDSLPENVGRLAPLVGLLASDELGGDRLIDFLNPRKRAEEKPKTLRNAVLIGVPVAAVLLLAFLGYRQLSGLDAQIAELRAANADMEDPVKLASVSRDRTQRIDAFLDGDVNWLNEIRRLAETMPSAEDMIVRSVTGTVDPRSGGGTLQVLGGATDPSVIDEFETALRDQDHRVLGDGAKDNGKPGDKYRWGFNEKITIAPSTVREQRYAALTSITAKPTEVGIEPEPAPEPEPEPAEVPAVQAAEAPAEATEAPVEATEAPAEADPTETQPADTQPQAGDATEPQQSSAVPPDEPDPDPPTDSDAADGDGTEQPDTTPQPADKTDAEVTS